MYVRAWKKQTPRLARFDLFLKIRLGIMGYFAILASTGINSNAATTPKTSRQMIVTEFHGKYVPPSSRPKRKRSVPATIKKAPSQSMAAKPSKTGVLGVVRSRNKRMIKKASPSRGKLI